MLQTLVIGLGRAGAGLHLPVLNRLRANEDNRNLFDEHPIVGCDSAQNHRGYDPRKVIAESIVDTLRFVDPDRTVVHLCTPPAGRARPLGELARLGFRKIIVEKPLATREDEIRSIVSLQAKYQLDIAVVAHWLCAELTRRLATFTNRSELGALRRITVRQHKPRFSRSAGTSGHPTAFDVEVPHALGVVLHLAGPARLTGAECTAMPSAGREIPCLGGAQVRLSHASGIRSEIHSNLTSPIRERRITLRFERGLVIGHYPVSEADDHAQLRVIAGGRREHTVFRDDALEAFLLAAYRYFAGTGPAPDAGWEFQTGAARLLMAAKRYGEPVVCRHAG